MFFDSPNKFDFKHTRFKYSDISTFLQFLLNFEDKNQTTNENLKNILFIFEEKLN